MLIFLRTYIAYMCLPVIKEIKMLTVVFSISEVGQIWPTNCFCKLTFIETQSRPFIYISPMVAFTLTMAELNSFNREHIASKGENISHLAFYGEVCWYPHNM